MPKKPAPPAHLPITAAADRIGVHTNTLRTWADNGTIESVRDSYNRRLFPVAAVEAAATKRNQK